jgi:hypothetical protein
VSLSNSGVEIEYVEEGSGTVVEEYALNGRRGVLAYINVAIEGIGIIRFVSRVKALWVASPLYNSTWHILALLKALHKIFTK